MSANPTRTFESRPAVREQTPLLLGLVGPSGTGKTFSALRLATGIQRVSGGDVYVVDTEAKRALHYADRFKFHHLPFAAPFSPLDYLAAVEHCHKRGGKVIVVDSLSHEHEGPGGVLEMHEQELDRLAGQDWEKRKRMTFLAWAKPKQQRRRFINSLLQIPVHVICCFRAKPKLKIVRGQEPVPRGYQPIAGEEFIYEMTAKFWLHPGANGFPSWESEHEDERAMMKLPEQFRGFFRDRVQLTEDVGQKLAEWAAGAPPGTSPPPPASQPTGPTLKERVEGLLARFDVCQARADFEGLEKERAALWGELGETGKRKLKAASEAAAKRVDDAIEARIESLKGPGPPEDGDDGEPGDDQGEPDEPGRLFGGDTTDDQMDALRR
jgi:energy-coupling factor transporter ATP-binding protein EcfA2